MDMGLAKKREEMVFAIMSEVAADQEGRIGSAGDAVHRMGLLGVGKMPQLHYRGVRAVEGHVELALLTEAVPPVPARLVPAVRHVDLEAVGGPAGRGAR